MPTPAIPEKHWIVVGTDAPDDTPHGTIALAKAAAQELAALNVGEGYVIYEAIGFAGVAAPPVRVVNIT